VLNKTAIRAWLLIMPLLLSGCSGMSVFSNYPGQAERWQQAYQSGQQERLIRDLEGRRTSRDGLLYSLELGRYAQLLGDHETSRQAFDQAFQQFRENDEKALVSATALTASTSALVTNDNARPYRGADYERIFAHSLQALNYLAEGNRDGVAVELRRANLEQGVAAERRARELARSSEDAEEENVDVRQFESQFAGLNVAAGRVKSSFQNAYTFYLSATLWEAAGEHNAAWIDYKRALEINPEALFIQDDVLRLSRRMGEPVEARMPGADEGMLVVVFEQGRVPQKRDFSLPIPTIHGYFAVAFPTYSEADIPTPVPLMVTDRDGDGLIRTQVVADVAAMAARSLQEDVPAMLVRQTLRAITKYNLQKQANDASPLAGFATNIYNLVSETADLRSWLSLPANVQAGRAIVPAGEKRIMLSGAGIYQALDVNVRPGGITLVRVVNLAGVPRVESYEL